MDRKKCNSQGDEKFILEVLEEMLSGSEGFPQSFNDNA